MLTLIVRVAAFDANLVTVASSYTSVIAQNPNNIRSENGGSNLGFINSGDWLGYSDFQFGAGVEYGWVEASSGGSGGTIELRLGSSNGALVGSVAIPNTGGWGNYRKFRFKLTQMVSNSQELFLRFVGTGSGGLLNLSKFSFGTPDWKTDISADGFAVESHPGNAAIISTSNGKLTNIADGSWVDYGSIDFGAGLEYLWIEAASLTGGQIEFRTGSQSGTLLGTVAIANTGSLTSYKPFGLKLSQPVSGVQSLFLKFNGGSGNLFYLSKFRFQRLAPDYKPPTPSSPWEYSVMSQGMRSAAAFSSEIDSNDENNIRATNGTVGYIKNNSWVTYANLDLGTNVNAFTILGTSQNSGGNVEIRLGSEQGTLIGTVAIPSNGSWDNYQPYTTTLNQTLSGVQQISLKFTGSSQYVFNVASFRFHSQMPEARSPGRQVAANLFDSESHAGAAAITTTASGISSITGESWVKYDNYQFGLESDLITLEAATAGKGGRVEVRLDSATGPLIGTIPITFTGSSSHFRPFTTALVQKVSGMQSLVLKFVDIHGVGGDLFELKNLVIGKKIAAPDPSATEGNINVYPSINNLDDSPYYTFSVQKVSALDAPLKQNATNWLSPFAWFTECVNPLPNSGEGYYSQFIGGWSHTYCNFEMDRKTPIVVKITRKNVSGAPSGPIFMANVHPAHKVISCEVIAGDVYVTMSEPALITVDIDGQLDNRDAPRALPGIWGGAASPYNSKENGAHAVSIFANPFIPNKPQPGDPGVRVIQPGQPLPATNDDSWTTLYFAPGIHNLSQDANGMERPWLPSDPVALRSGKNYYLPGNAILYGNFDDRVGNNTAEKKNIRFYGHGTISMKNVPHWSEYSGQVNIRLVNIHKGRGCHFEGITISNPAEFGICIENFEGGSHIAQNSMRWVKSIAWRKNTDVGQMSGGVVEDCFFRHQDDGYYIGDCQIRRSVFWTDVNGTPFHSPNIVNRQAPMEDTMFPRDVVIEDCDVIYARGMYGFGGSGYGVISNHLYTASNTYRDGAPNTAQHVVFRNIRVTDPRPVRPLFGMNIDSTNTQFTGWAGMRFENIEYRHPQTWGYKNFLVAGPNGAMTKCYFDKVNIAGRQMDATLVADTTAFGTSFLTDLVFTGLIAPSASVYNFLSHSPNGSVASAPVGKIHAPSTTILASAEGAPGYRFLSWGGDLAGSAQPASITMSGHKSIIANFDVAPRNTTIDTTGGTTILNYDSPQNTYIGNGILRISSDGSPDRQILFGQESDNSTTLSMTGGQITIDSEVTLVNGGWQKGIWISNLADMQINGTLDLSNGNPVRVNALNGSGAITVNHPSAVGARQIQVGVGGGSGTFSGSIQSADTESGNFIRFEKFGAGTQTLNHLANQNPKQIVIHQGAIELTTQTNVACAADFSGSGDIVKSGTGSMILSGSIANTGKVTINQGTAVLTSAPSAQMNLVVATNALLDLSYSGTATISALQLGSSNHLPPGIYGKDHPIYGSFFTTGSGTVRISGTNYQVWAGTHAVVGGNDDFDSDGLANPLEYVLGGNPRMASKNLLPVAKLEGEYLMMSFKRADESEQDSTIVGEWSNNLSSWYRSDVTMEVLNENSSQPDDMLIKIPLSKTQNGRLFGRIGVSSN